MRDTCTQSRAQAELGSRNAVEGSRARTAGTQSPALQPAVGAGQGGSTVPSWQDPHQHLSVQPLHLPIKFCQRWAMVQWYVCPHTTPSPPCTASHSCSPAPLWSPIRASGRGDIVPSWRGTVSACEPTHFIHCTSTFPTGIISIKPSALPSSPGLHPLGCLRYCSICEPAQADATSLSPSAKKTNGDSDRTDAPGGFDALLSQATRSTCASAPSERHTAPLENLSHFLSIMGRHHVPDCQKRRAESRVELSASMAALVQSRSVICQVMNTILIRHSEWLLILRI